MTPPSSPRLESPSTTPKTRLHHLRGDDPLEQRVRCYEQDGPTGTDHRDQEDDYDRYVEKTGEDKRSPESDNRQTRLPG